MSSDPFTGGVALVLTVDGDSAEDRDRKLKAAVERVRGSLGDAELLTAADPLYREVLEGSLVAGKALADRVERSAARKARDQ